MLTQDRRVWTLGWTEIHSASYGLKEALIKGAAEVTLQITDNFILNPAFQQSQQQTQLSLDSNLFLADSDHAVHTGSLKMNVVFLPAIIDTEFLSQVPGKIVRRLLGIFFIHRVVGAHIYKRHRTYRVIRDRASLDACQAFRQSAELC